MDAVLLISGITQIVLSLLIGVLFIYSAFKVFLRMTLKMQNVEEFENNNIAISILISSIIFAVILVVKNAIEPAGTVLSLTLRDPNAGLSSFIQSALIMLLHIIISGTLSFLCVYLALGFFTWLTRDLDEMGQIRKNNIAVSILVAAIIISVALLVQSGIKDLLDSIVPFPPVSMKDIG